MVGCLPCARCLTYIIILNAGALHTLPYLILYAHFWETVPIFQIQKVCILFSATTDFAGDFLLSGAFAGVISCWSIFTTCWFPECQLYTWHFTHYRVLRKCTVYYFLNADERTIVSFLSWKRLLLNTQKSSHRIICFESWRVLGVKTTNSPSFGLVGTNMVTCVFCWDSLDPAQGKMTKKWTPDLKNLGMEVRKGEGTDWPQQGQHGIYLETSAWVQCRLKWHLHYFVLEFP